MFQITPPKNGHEERVPKLVLGCAIFVFLFSTLYNIIIFERVPHIHDEIAYLFQAQIFMTGHLYAHSPCARTSFDFPHIINNGRWYSIYPPGFPFLLMIGLILRAPFIINPSFAALSVVLFYFIGKETFDKRTGIYASVLGSLSPWLLLMSATFLSHTTSMFFNALFLLFLLKTLRSPSL